MSLTDSRRMYVLLRDAGEAGVHSHHLRASGTTGNPAQRAKDIASHGVGVFTARENVGKRPGSRYWLEQFAPDWAVPVRPNGGVEGGGGAAHGPADAAPLNITPSSETNHPVAVIRDFDGSWVELPWDEEKHRPLEEAA